jgi:MFS family permease
MELARSAAFAAGPALGGALVGWTGPVIAFGVAAALSTWAVVTLRGLREPARSGPPPRDLLHELREGAVLVFGHPLLRPVLLTAVFFNTSFFVLQAVYVPYAIHHLGSPRPVSASPSPPTASAIAAALAAMPTGVRHRHHPRPVTASRRLSSWSHDLMLSPGLPGSPS